MSLSTSSHYYEIPTVHSETLQVGGTCRLSIQLSNAAPPPWTLDRESTLAGTDTAMLHRHASVSRFKGAVVRLTRVSRYSWSEKYLSSSPCASPVSILPSPNIVSHFVSMSSVTRPPRLPERWIPGRLSRLNSLHR